MLLWELLAGLLLRGDDEVTDIGLRFMGQIVCYVIHPQIRRAVQLCAEAGANICPGESHVGVASAHVLLRLPPVLATEGGARSLKHAWGQVSRNPFQTVCHQDRLLPIFVSINPEMCACCAACRRSSVMRTLTARALIFADSITCRQSERLVFDS